MARRKAAWRRVLTARFLRWWLACQAIRLVPPIGRWLGFFPKSVDMIEAADNVLADDHGLTAPLDHDEEKSFLELCRPHDSAAPGVDPFNGAPAGRRTALYDDAWIDISTGSVLLPRKQRTVLVRGQRANWNATSIRFARPKVRVEGRAMGLLNTGNYFHLILENGARVIDLMESGLVMDAPLTLVKPPDRGEVERAMMRGLEELYPALTIVRFSDGTLALPDQALCHFPRDEYWEWPPLDRNQAHKLGQVFETSYGAIAADGPSSLYLTRDGAKLRTALNTDELDQTMTDNGFEPFTATDSNHPAQISRFRSADIVVAIHGAGLTNLVFCRPGTKVIEIFPSNFVKSPYWQIAAKLGLVYRPVLGGAGDYDQRFEVDIAALKAALDQIGDS
ncbi:MAG: glycosyltransferase family 61 protein [Pseudomonadota bacterium]